MKETYFPVAIIECARFYTNDAAEQYVKLAAWLFFIFIWGFYVTTNHDDAGRGILRKEKGEERMIL